MCCKSSKHVSVLKQLLSTMQFKDKEWDCNYQICSKKVSHEAINYIGDSLKLCQETDRHIILSQQKKNYILQSDLVGQAAQRRKVYGDYVTSQTKGTLMEL